MIFKQLFSISIKLIISFAILWTSYYTNTTVHLFWFLRKTVVRKAFKGMPPTHEKAYERRGLWCVSKRSIIPRNDRGKDEIPSMPKYVRQLPKINSSFSISSSKSITPYNQRIVTQERATMRTTQTKNTIQRNATNNVILLIPFHLTNQCQLSIRNTYSSNFTTGCHKSFIMSRSWFCGWINQGKEYNKETKYISSLNHKETKANMSKQNLILNKRENCSKLVACLWHHLFYTNF